MILHKNLTFKTKKRKRFLKKNEIASFLLFFIFKWEVKWDGQKKRKNKERRRRKRRKKKRGEKEVRKKRERMKKERKNEKDR